MNDEFITSLRADFSVRGRYLVGVSGGRDSVVLLDCLLKAGFRKLVVCHLNHGLRRGASGRDAVFVQRLTERYKLPMVTEKVAVAGLAERKGLSIETAAREARRAFFAQVAKEQRCGRVFLAHHAEDQAETVLMNVARGSGIGGLAGMQRVSQQMVNGVELEFLRPLLDVRRREIDAWIAQRGLKYREDASNADPAVGVRNRVRGQVLPQLDVAFGRDVSASLLRLAEMARGNEALIAELCADDLALATADDWLPVDRLRAMPGALRLRVLREWLRAQAIPDCGVAEAQRVNSLLDEPVGQAPAKINLPGGWHARRREGRVFLQPETAKESAPGGQ